MADITMCQNESCPKKEDCFRYKAEPNRNQSYFTFTTCPTSDFKFFLPTVSKKSQPRFRRKYD